ncbi:MAG TPA: hypothetical protein DIW86_00980 [Pseudomonas sp.]|nr:hypothetical protein [Pseudomonas sp.]
MQSAPELIVQGQFTYRSGLDAAESLLGLAQRPTAIFASSDEMALGAVAAAGEADIAVRMVRPSQEQLLARRVGLIEVGLHARDDYLEQHGTPQQMQDLAHHSVIGFDQENAFIRSLAIKGFERSAFALSSDSDLAQLALIRAGAGIGGCQVLLAKRDPRLRRVLAQGFSIKLDTWVTMHEDLRNSPRCRVMFDALVEGLQRYVQD